MANDQLIQLKEAFRENLAKLREQLLACQSNKFALYRIGADGQKIDATPAHIAMLKRVIADYESLLSTPQ